jgi:hypothetical protein
MADASVPAVTARLDIANFQRDTLRAAWRRWWW